MANASTIIERMRNGELILESDPDYPLLYKEFEKTMNLVGDLNTGYHTDLGSETGSNCENVPSLLHGIRKINPCR